MTTTEDHFFLAVQRWLQNIEGNSVTLTCFTGARTPLGTKRRPSVEIAGCLQELPLHRLVDLTLAGVKDVAVAPTSCCEGTELDELLTRWREQLGGMVGSTIVDAPPTRNWTWSIAPTRVPVDRRGLLGLSRRSTPPWPTHDPDSDDHARLLTSLRAAGVSAVEQPPPGVALAASGCTACGVCVAACPHDALNLVVDGKWTTLQHSMQACQGEQQCVALCPVNALTTPGKLSWDDVLEGLPVALASMEMSVCERCRTRFPAASESRWCETCRIRRSDPFGSHLPEAAIKLLQARGFDRPA